MNLAHVLPKALAVLLAASPTSIHALSISLASLESEYTLTDGIRLRLGYLNDEDRSLFLARPRSFGTGTSSLRIIAENSGCQYEAGPIHYETRVEDLKFFFVPLMQGDTLTQRLPTVADATSIGGVDLLLPGPGMYTFHVEFSSHGDSYEAFIGPVWRGTVKSNKIEVNLRPPTTSEVNMWRRKLQECVSAGSCMAAPAVRYFAHVRDDQAAELLIGALRAEPNDSFAAEALFRQAIPRAAQVLRTAAARRSTDRENAQYYVELAERLEGDVGGGCPEVLSDNDIEE